MGVNIGGHLNVRVSHELFCHIERDTSFLQIGAKSVTQTIWGEIWSYHRFYDSIPLGLCA